MNTLTTWTPIRDFGRIASLADSLFRSGACADTECATARSWVPAVNVTEDDQAYRISADLPDVPAADVKVVVRDGVLTLSGERKWEKKSEKTKYHLVESGYGSFSRSFTLPRDVDGEKVAAEFRSGVLSVTVPKREEVKPRQIEVKIG